MVPYNIATSHNNIIQWSISYPQYTVLRPIIIVSDAVVPEGFVGRHLN